MPSPPDTPQQIFDAGYVGRGTESDRVLNPPSATIPVEDFGMPATAGEPKGSSLIRPPASYGLGKPRRFVLRARVVND